MVAYRAMQEGSFYLGEDPKRVYLDHNATTPLAALIEPKVMSWLSEWGNPSSIHWSGRGPKALLRDSRRSVARLIGADPLEVIFTSGGSESNNLAIKGVYEYLSKGSPVREGASERVQYILSAVEHPSVVKTMDYLRAKGAQVDIIPVNREGEIDLAAYQALLGPRTALVSVMYANNETGHIFPIKKMAAMAHEAGALFHCDAVQALGKAVVDVKKWGVDLASFSGHKFYSMKGCGFLFAKKGIQIESLIHGGGQERGRRAGTENVLAIAALGEMAKHVNEIETRAGQMKELRDYLQAELLSERFQGVHITGAKGKRVPNTISAVIEGVDGETLLMNLDMKGFSVSTGAACSSGSPEPSPVLLAMGLSRDEAQSSLRLSLGWGTTKEQVDRFLDTLVEVVTRLRSFNHGEKTAYGL